ncbi:hypothetical protein D3C84_900680 [compost metagenome]
MNEGPGQGDQLKALVDHLPGGCQGLHSAYQRQRHGNLPPNLARTLEEVEFTKRQIPRLQQPQRQGPDTRQPPSMCLHVGNRHGASEECPGAVQVVPATEGENVRTVTFENPGGDRGLLRIYAAARRIGLVELAAHGEAAADCILDPAQDHGREATAALGAAAILVAAAIAQGREWRDCDCHAAPPINRECRHRFAGSPH